MIQLKLEFACQVFKGFVFFAVLVEFVIAALRDKTEIDNRVIGLRLIQQSASNNDAAFGSNRADYNFLALPLQRLTPHYERLCFLFKVDDFEL